MTNPTEPKIDKRTAVLKKYSWVVLYLVAVSAVTTAIRRVLVYGLGFNDSMTSAVLLTICVVAGWYADEVIGWLRSRSGPKPTRPDLAESGHVG